MVAALARSLCSVLVLFGLAGQPGSLIQNSANSTSLRGRAATFAADDDSHDDALSSSRKLTRRYRVTAYCDRGITAAGIPSDVGQCAAPADIPFGTQIYIPELGRTLVVTDRTAPRFRHNTVDIFIPVRSDCLEFGRRYLDCELTLPEAPLRYGSQQLRLAVASLRS